MRRAWRFYILQEIDGVRERKIGRKRETEGETERKHLNKSLEATLFLILPLLLHIGTIYFLCCLVNLIVQFIIRI